MTFRFPDVLCSRVSFRLSVSQVDSRVILRGSTFNLSPFHLLLLSPYLDAHLRSELLSRCRSKSPHGSPPLFPLPARTRADAVHVAQSMSKAGYPYDNAPMERYFNTLKNECTKLYEFRTDEELYQTRTATELAYAEVIGYNKKNLERKLQNKSQQQNKQQSRTKRREKEI